jgi:hypothetical protein
MVKVFGVVVVTLMVGLVVWLMRFLASIVSKDASDCRKNGSLSEDEAEFLLDENVKILRAKFDRVSRNHCGSLPID